MTVERAGDGVPWGEEGRAWDMPPLTLKHATALWYLKLQQSLSPSSKAALWPAALPPFPSQCQQCHSCQMFNHIACCISLLRSRGHPHRLREELPELLLGPGVRDVAHAEPRGGDQEVGAGKLGLLLNCNRSDSGRGERGSHVTSGQGRTVVPRMEGRRNMLGQPSWDWEHAWELCQQAPPRSPLS